MNHRTASQEASASGHQKAEHSALRHVVECKSFAKFFEPIAAFNCLEAAESYKAECAKVNRIFQYRVNSHYEG
jgi:hypothetical protein